MVGANYEIKEYVHNLAKNEKQEEYQELVKSFVEEQQKMQEKLDELAELKKKGKKWVSEIDEEIAFFNKGFAEIEEHPTIEKIQGKIDWYQGQIEAGNK
jgi:hypothetical protein